MDRTALRETLRFTRAAEHLGCLTAGDWPDLAVALLLEGADDLEIAQLAGLNRRVSGWTVDALTAPLYERLTVRSVTADDAVRALAALLAEDLQVRPSVVTAPMIRLLARLAPLSNFESTLANECYHAEEYLDCDCVGQVDPTLEAELAAMSAPAIPDAVVRVLAAPLRANLPVVQPPDGH